MNLADKHGFDILSF